MKTMKEISPSEQAPPMEVPPEALSAETTLALIESFILREGTDYGPIEINHSVKMQQIERQLKAGKIKIIFDPHSESVTLMTTQEWKKNKLRK